MEGKDGDDGKKRKLEISENTPEISEEVAAKLLEPLTKEHLVDILKPALIKHSDVLHAVRKITDKDSSLRKLFVRGLGFETTSEALTEVFSEHGEIEDSTVIVDRTTGKNKGYGFVTYRHVDGCLSALQEPSKKVDGRMVVSNLAVAGNQQQSQQLQQQQQQQNQLLQLQQHQQLQQQLIQPMLPLQTIQPIQPVKPIQPIQPVNSFLPARPDVKLRRLYVGNVPTNMQPARLMNFFSQYGDIEEGPLGYDLQTGKSKGYSLIVYKTIEGIHRALEDPVKSIDGHQLFCKLAVEGHKLKANQEQAIPNSIDKGHINPASLNHVSQYGGVGHGLVNPALLAHQNTMNQTSLATSLPYNSLNSSVGLLPGTVSGRASLGVGSYGINPYGSSGYGSHPYSSIGGAASLYGIPPSSSVAQTAAYDGASHYSLASHQAQRPGTSPPSGVLPGMRSYYAS